LELDSGLERTITTVMGGSPSLYNVMDEKALGFVSQLLTEHVAAI